MWNRWQREVVVLEIVLFLINFLYIDMTEFLSTYSKYYVCDVDNLPEPHFKP